MLTIKSVKSFLNRKIIYNRYRIESGILMLYWVQQDKPKCFFLKVHRSSGSETPQTTHEIRLSLTVHGAFDELFLPAFFWVCKRIRNQQTHLQHNGLFVL